MPFDYVAAFPLSVDLIPERLRNLLTPVGLNPREAVEVACMYEAPDRDVNEENVYIQMAVVQDKGAAPLGVFDEAGQGVVAFSVPFDGKGNAAECRPSLSGHDYIVGSWGSGSFYTYNLAEKVWMTLGLTPRCIGNDHQKLIYDDLGLPEFGVAQGEISNEYYWRSIRNINWSMSNEYLRKYLWLRAARGVRAIYYKKMLPDHPEIRKLRVEGHTDNRGNAEHNLQLSKARAASVVQYLVKSGIDPARLESEGYGATQPLVPNLTPAARAKNRRVAFKILEKGPPPEKGSQP